MLETSRLNSVGSMTMSNTVEFAFTLGPKCFNSSAKAFAIFADVLLIVIHIVIGAYMIDILRILIQRISLFSLHGIQGYITTGLAVLPVFLLKDLKFVVPFSVIANLLTLAVFFSLIVQRIIFNTSIEAYPKLINFQVESLVFVGLCFVAINSFGLVCTVPQLCVHNFNYYFILIVHNRGALSLGAQELFRSAWYTAHSAIVRMDCKYYNRCRLLTFVSTALVFSPGSGI